MFGKKSRRKLSSAVGDRIDAAVLQIVGPASVEGAIQGHSPEARAHWQHRVEENKRVRREARLQREADERGA
jgi:hypothetical protein